MVENMVRGMRESPEGDHTVRLQEAAAEFARPLAGSSAATIVIFVPLAFLSGVTGAFFKALSLTMAAGLIISFFIAWLAMPIVAARLLDENDRETEGGAGHRLRHLYRRLVHNGLLRPRLAIYATLPLLVLG